MNTENNQQNPYLKACALLGNTPRPFLEDKSDKDLVSEDAYHRLIICIRAKNMIDGKEWEPVYDGSEWHYYPRWKRNKSGFGFSHTHYAYWSTNTYVGSRLEYRSYDLMKEGIVEFKEYYDDYLS